MKLRTSFLTRFLALALALAMIASGANLGLVARVFAAETGKTITDGALVANNYASLSDAEKALLNSGLLAESTHEYNKPTDDDNLIEVDPVAKTVKAASFENWKFASAWLETADGEKEDIALDADGNGTIAGDHDAYTVFVTYELAIGVDTALQTTLLSTAGWLKQGVANTDAVSAQSGNLYILEQAMPELVNFVNNGVVIPNLGTANLSEEAQAAVRALNAQMTANGGKLNLSVMTDAYDAGSKTEYLMNNGAAMKAEVVDFVNKVAAIAEGLNALVANLKWVIDNGYIDENTANSLKTLAGITSKLEDGLTAVASDSWTILEKDVLADNVDYVKLDTLVAALGEISNVTVSSEALKADEATVKFGASMSDVTLVAQVEYYENGEKKSKDWNEIVTLSDSEINEARAKAEAETTVYADLTAWAEGKLDLAHFDRADSYNEETLTYTIAYAPKQYTVTYNYQDAEEVAYGVRITLPRHEDSSKAFDYTVNGTAYAQGSVITVEGPTDISREEGKAYTTNDLLSVIVNNGYGNEKTNKILSSGALYGNETIAVRYPDANKGALADFKEGSDTVIAAKPYAADYKGLSWAPYKYIIDGGDTKFFGNKTEVDVGAFKTSVEVYFRLTLDNYGAATTQKWMDLAVTLETEAAAQKATLDTLAASHDQMGMLDKTKLGALNGVIDVTDFTPGDGTDTDAETLRLRGEFKTVVGNIIAQNLDSNNYLKIYNMLTEYKAGGLVYYYNNYEAFKGEIELLSSYVNNLLNEEEALKIMVTAAGFPDYADKITDLGTTLDDAKAALSAPNAAIDLSDATKVATLVNALTMAGTAGTAKEVAAPYLDDSAPHTVNAKGYKGVTVTVKIAGQDGLAVSKQWVVEHVLTEADIAELKAEVNTKINELFANDNKAFYVGSYNGSELDALVGTTVADLKKVAYEYEWTLKTVTITVPGMDAQPVDKNNHTITLAPSADASIRYDYYIGEELITSPYTFTAEQLAAIFAGNAPTITRKEVNVGAENFAKFVKTLNDNIGREAAVYKDGTLTVSISTAELQGFVMGLVNSSYSYIGLDGDGFIYLNAEDTLEISIQTLVNAIVNENFDNGTIIDLADGSGALTTTTIELGNDEASATAYPFVLNLTGVPAEIAPVAEILNMGYIKINGTTDHKLNVELNLPEKLYQAYLTALIATGEVDLDDVAAVNNEIAVQFLWDYANGIITNDDITTETFENTLKKLGRDYDLSKYEDYYQKARTAIQEYLVVENGQASINFVDESGLLKKLLEGMLGESMKDLLGMIKECKTDEAGKTISGLEISANVTVKGIIDNYEALIVDNGDAGVNKFDYTTKLADETINGTAVVILLKDTTADLSFPGTALLDLNGFTLTGDITAKGNLMIIDSDMDTFNGGKVDGTVSGTATIMGGTYTSDVTASLKEGYKQNENGTVYNNLFTVAQDDAGNIVYSINADCYKDIADGKIPSVKALGIDIAGDLILNYFTAAYLQLEGERIYGVALDDLIAIYSGNTTDELIVDLLNTVSAPGISNFANAVIADVLDFKTISENVGKAPIATYTMTTAPWAVEITHVVDEDYLTVGIGYGETRPEYTVSLEIVGENRAVAEVRELTTALAEIVTKTDVTVNVEQPTYANNQFDVTGTAKAIVEIDLTKNENYTAVLAVILANGTGKASYVEALNDGDMAALKEAVDATTINDVFTALKALSRDVTFAEMADKVGATVTADAAKLEAVYHIYLTAAGAVLDRLDVSGGNRTLGSFDSDNDGVYVADKEDIGRTGDVSKKGYTVNYDLTLTELSLSVKVFGEIEPPVEEVAPIVVTDTEGNVVYEGDSFKQAIDAVKEGYTVTINEAVVADDNANAAYSFKVVGASNLDMTGKYLTITANTVEIETDAALNVVSSVDGYYVKSSVNASTNLITYSLAEIEAPTSEAPIAGSKGVKLEGINYLIVDLDPNGEEYADMVAALTFEKMEKLGYTATYSDGEGIVKNADQMTVTFVNADKVKVAQITYTVVVLGDVSGNGEVNSTDATKIQELHYRKLDATVAQLLAANICISTENSIQDVIDEDRAVYSVIINSTDATKIQEKFYFWNRDFSPYKSMLENYAE